MQVRVFAAEEASLRPMSAWLREACASMGASPAVVDDAELCANELFANTCDHAFPAGVRHPVTLTLAVAPGGVQLTLEDDGIAFDPVAAPLPPPLGAIAEARTRGHGLSVVRRLARAMRYERAADRNRLTLVFAAP